MASPIDIIINAIWRGRGDTERARRDLRGLGTSGERAAAGLDKTGQAAQRTQTNTRSLIKSIGAVTIALGAASIAARKLFSFIEEGAGLELTAQRFDRLALSIGTTGDALRTDLIEATSGMVSNAQAMALATDLIGLGLVKTHDDAVRLGRIVTELDADIGELTLALANQTTKRFDQLGISLEGFNERLSSLKGTMADEDAFTMAFLEQAEAQIERVGGASQTTAGDIRRLQADYAALREEMSLGIAVSFGPFLAAASGRIANELREQGEAAADSAESVADLTRAFQTLNEEAERLRRQDAATFKFFIDEGVDDAFLSLARGVAQTSDSLPEFRRNLAAVGFELDIAQENGKLTEGVLLRLGNEVYNTARIFEEATAPVDEHTEAMTRNDAIMRQLGSSTDTVTDKNEELSASLEILIGQWESNARAADDFSRRLEQLNRGVGLGVGFADEISPREQREQEEQLLQDRSDLFQDFQSDLTTINQREEEQRLQITEQFEERRTQAVANYNQQRLQEEEDFQRRQARQDAQLADDIADVRDDANKRLRDLEEDHLDRMRQITDDADASLREAASSLSARQVGRIIEARDRALQEERERFDDQRQQIQENAEERIADLQEFHDERQAQEEEDRRIRLQRMEQAHQEQLRELKKQEQDRLRQLRSQAQQERNERERQYTEERFQLSDHWGDRQQLEQEWMNTILQQEEEWWRQRSGLVGGGSTGGVGDGGTGDTGGGDDAGGAPTGDGRPSRWWLEHQAFQIANPSTTEAALAWQSYFRSLTNEQLAAWIEQHSDIDVPGYLHGIDRVPGTGLALLHEGEAVLDRREAEIFRSGMSQSSRGSRGNVFNGDFIFNVNEARRPGQTGREVRKEIEKFLEEVSA